MRHNYGLPKGFQLSPRLRQTDQELAQRLVPATLHARSEEHERRSLARLDGCRPASGGHGVLWPRRSVAPASGGGDGGGGGVITSDWPVGRGALLWLFHMARGRSDCQSAACRASIRSCTVTTTICSQRQRVHVDMRMCALLARSLEARLPARPEQAPTHKLLPQKESKKRVTK